MLSKFMKMAASGVLALNDLYQVYFYFHNSRSCVALRAQLQPMNLGSSDGSIVS